MITLLLLALASAPPSGVPHPPVAPRTRTYYIAADEVSWDYVPGGRDEIAGRPYVDSAFFASTKPRAVNTVYRKVLYREYTDSTFQTLKPRPPEWEHLGFLGPVIHAVVGDTIRVVFRNNGHRPYSMHPHGVFYEKSSEGAPYNDGAGNDDEPVTACRRAQRFVYVWPVPARAGPGPMDGSSVMWMYHSHVDEVRDINTGLLGAMIITARDMARPDGTPKDVDREIVTAFAQVEENFSWLADQNLPPMDSVQSLKPIPNPSETDAGYPWYVKFTINGFIHGSMPLSALTVQQGQARALVRDVLDQRFRRPRAALARQRRAGRGHADRRAHALVHGDGDRQHGAGRPRYLALPLPRLVPQLGGHGGALSGHELSLGHPYHDGQHAPLLGLEVKA